MRWKDVTFKCAIETNHAWMDHLQYIELDQGLCDQVRWRARCVNDFALTT